MGVIMYGIGQKFYGFPIVSTMNEEFSKGYLLSLGEWSRISSTFAGHYDLAAYLVMTLAVIVALIFAVSSRWKKILSRYIVDIYPLLINFNFIANLLCGLYYQLSICTCPS